MMMQNAARAEKLDVAQLAAQGEHETETSIYVLAWVGQARANDQDPTLYGRRNEQLFFARQSFDPGTRFGMVQAECGLDGEQIAALDGDPTSRPNEIAGVPTAGQRIKLKCRWPASGAMLTYQRGDEECHGHACAQRQAEEQQQQSRHEVPFIHPAINLRARRVTSTGEFPSLRRPWHLRFTGMNSWLNIDEITPGFASPIQVQCLAHPRRRSCWLLFRIRWC